MQAEVTASDFDAPDLLDMLESSLTSAFDNLPFGVITMDRDGDVVGFNEYESSRSGIDANRVLGRNFFESVGPCTNNYLIAQRFHDETELDETLDFVFTLRMAPTPVRLRLLARSDSQRQFLIVMNR